MYKMERRPKHPGCKLHLDDKETQEFLDWYQKYKDGFEVEGEAFVFTKRIAKSIKKLLAEDSLLLEERTEEQVKEALLKDQKKIVEQLQTMESGADWKKVK